MTVEDEINRLRDMLAQLPLDQQQRVVPELIDRVRWFLEINSAPETGNTYTSYPDRGVKHTTAVMHTTSYSSGRSRTYGMSVSRPSKVTSLGDES
jgi:hypothetical protein